MSGYEYKERDQNLRDALLWLTLFDAGLAEPGDASLFLDSIEDHWLPTEEEVKRVGNQRPQLGNQKNRFLRSR